MTGFAVVGGGTGALGAAICGRLAGAGLDVVAISRGGNDVGAARGLAADLEDDRAIAAIAGAVDGPVRMVVQAAGLPGGADLDSLSGDVLGAAMNRKVGGFLRMIRAVAPHLGSGSRLVALGGHYGYEPSPAAPLAGMVNAALASLVRMLADRHGPDGVTSHLVAPGPVESPRMTAIAERVASGRPGSSPEEVLAGYRAASPLGRLTTTDEVAWAVALLLDPSASAMTGGALSLDAGRRKGLA